MEGKLITTNGLTAYTQQLKTWIGDTYQTKADMALYTKTNDLFTYLDTRYIAQNSPIYGNPIYKHRITVLSEQYFRISLTIFTTRTTAYNTANEFRKDWTENRTIISVLADAISPDYVFKGTVVGVIVASGNIAIRISGIRAGIQPDSTASDWDHVYTFDEWSYLEDPSRI